MALVYSTGKRQAPRGRVSLIGISVRAYARLTDRSEAGVRKAIKTKRISVLADGSLDPERANREWAQNTFAGQTLGAKAAQTVKQTSQPSPASPPAESGEPPITDPITSYLRSRAIKEDFNSRLAKLEYEVQTGKLIPAEKAGEYAASFSAIVKESLMAIPGRLAPLLASMMDENAIHKVLSAEIAAILRKMSKSVTDAGL